MSGINTTERYTWECLWADSCDGCLVAKYVRTNELDKGQQGKLLSLASAAGSYLTGPGAKTRDEVVELLTDSDLNDASTEEVEVAVDGFIQWEAKGCREEIRQGE